VVWEVRVEQVLHAPDPCGGVGGPGRELLWERADMRPRAGAGECGGTGGGGAEGGEGGWGDEGGEDDEAVAFE
jgi:hypothetical protein